MGGGGRGERGGGVGRRGAAGERKGRRGERRVKDGKLGTTSEGFPQDNKLGSVRL